MKNQIEVLAYSPTDMLKFIDYFKNGLKDKDGKPKEDPKLGKAYGVVAWLHGREIDEAHFFSTDPGVPVRFFAAMIKRKEPENVPWMDNIPCFPETVDTDGLCGEAADFGSAMPPTMSTPFGWLKPRPDLDALFSKQKKNIAKINFDALGFTRQDFLLALQGKPGTDLDDLLSKINTQFKLDVMAV